MYFFVWWGKYPVTLLSIIIVQALPASPDNSGHELASLGLLNE